MSHQFDRLAAYQRQTEALSRIAQRLGWDHETTMASGSAGDRSEEMAALEATVHARNTASELGDLLGSVAPSDLSAPQQRQYDLIARSYERTQKIPADLSVALARINARSHQAWAKAKAENDTSQFLPTLAEVITLTQEKAHALASGTDQTAYGALFQDYEPDGDVTQVATMFDDLRPHLVALRERVLSGPKAPQITGHFPQVKQMELTRDIAAAFGFDANRGRIDVALHPFSSGGGNDVRITTRFNTENPLESIYSTIHEVGHACYEQNITDGYNFTILGQGVSLGVHESQSRLYENQLGRSREFCAWLFGKMRDTFGDIGVSNEDEFYRAVNAVTKGFIRTESDEVQYNLHIMLRFDLERALMSGDLSVDDLETAWNDRFFQDFGFHVDKPANGMLQDVHWCEGLFGYFPTYSIGNIYAANLWRKICDDVPDVRDQMAQGNTAPARDWLCQHVQKFGAEVPADTLITQACQSAPTAEPFVTYIGDKFSAFQ